MFDSKHEIIGKKSDQCSEAVLEDELRPHWNIVISYRWEESIERPASYGK